MSEHVSSYYEDSVLQKLPCPAEKALLRNPARLMQIVNDVTWIMPESSDKGDPYKVSKSLLFE
jgi:hypothetical protein